MKNKFFLSLLTAAALMLATQPAAQAAFHLQTPYQNVNGKLLVSASVNGVKGRFILDTGAPCCLTWSFASRASVKMEGQTLTAEDSNGLTTQNAVVVLDSLNLGGVSFRGLQAMCLAQGNMVEAFGLDGIIGYNLFKMGAVKFDGKNSLFLFDADPSALSLPTTCAQPLIEDPYIVRVPVSLGEGRSDTVMFDSGAESFYEMSNARYLTLKNTLGEIRQLGSARGILSAGAAGLEKGSTKYRLKIPHFALGTARFDNVTTITTDGTDSRIGSSLLTLGDVAIDYRHNLFYFIPNDTTRVPNLYQPEWDVVITVMEGHLCAGLVWDTAGLPLKGGETIVSVNGQSFKDVDLRQATTTPMINMSGDTATIGYLDAATGQEKQVTIHRR